MSKPSGISVQHVQEQAGLVVDRGARHAGHGAGGLVDDGDLVDDLLVVEGDDELVVSAGRGSSETPRLGTPLSTSVKFSVSSYWFSSSR